MSGLVLNRAGLELPRETYDLLVIGGGLLGLALAFYLRRLLPDATLLVAEQDGVPSELGATWAAPGLVLASRERPAEAAWGWRTLAGLEAETALEAKTAVRLGKALEPVGLLDFDTENREAEHGDAGGERLPLEALPLEAEQRAAVTALLGPAATAARHEDRAGYASAEAVALAYGHGAVAHGADLLLNARLRPLGSGCFEAERLEYDRSMVRVAAARTRLVAGTVVLAAGAATPRLVESLALERTPYRLAYRQYPRLERDARLPLAAGRVRLPLLRASGFVLRPQGEGLLIVPPPLPPDPLGYEPVGGELMGVRVGLRRELLESLLEASETLPVLGWPHLNLGKTPANLRGAWEVVTPSGLPEWRAFGDVYALVGGGSLGLELAAAYDLAATLAGTAGRPWEETA